MHMYLIYSFLNTSIAKFFLLYFNVSGRYYTRRICGSGVGGVGNNKVINMIKIISFISRGQQEAIPSWQKNLN